MTLLRASILWTYGAVLWCVPLVTTAQEPQDALAAPTVAGLEFFEQKIRPLLINRCYECHAVDSAKLGGNLRLDDRQAIARGGDNGAAAVPGKSTDSLLIRAVNYIEPGFEMPPTGKLSASEIRLLERWVDMGLPMPDVNSASSAPAKRVIDIAEGKQHWAFQPLASNVPAVDPSGWSRNPIDQYVLAAQRQRGLSPLPPAEPGKLLRRIKFDLLGLPPTVEELDRFLAAPSDDALSHQIDQWLSTPEYGERWGRFWLELVRYCDVAESWAETQGNAYLYRDWVVAAYNADMPLDRFAKLQLAADLIPEARPDDLAALGMIGLSPNYWKELQLPVEIIKTIVSDEYEERVHTFSSTFLGLNMACARCHDHKFDPITVEDYYALAGVFANTRVADRALLPGVDSLAIYEAHKNVEKWQAEQKKLEGELKKLQAEASKLASAAPSNATATEAAPPALSDAQREQLDKLTRQQSEKQEALDKLSQQIDQAQRLPGFTAPLAPGAMEGTLEVKEAVGTHGSRLLYETTPKDLAIEIRGNPNKTSYIVPRRYVAVLSSVTNTAWQGSGRAELAQAMFQQSAALVARVYVNRLWKHHFGIGLVDTPSDFGTQGAPPSHPELLDHLASEFIQHDWSTKWLHRQILTSATYQQQCRTQAKSLDANSSIWYVGMPLQRLDVEQWRDAMLAATGTLDQQIGGPPTELSQGDHRRRTLYGTVRRRELSDVLRLNDVPDPLTHSAQRTATTTPLQQLYVLNSPFMQQQARELVNRMHREVEGDSAVKITAAYQWLYGRRPSERELSIARDYLRGEGRDLWDEYAQALLASNEFFFVD